MKDHRSSLPVGSRRQRTNVSLVFSPKESCPSLRSLVAPAIHALFLPPFRLLQSFCVNCSALVSGGQLPFAPRLTLSRPSAIQKGATTYCYICWGQRGRTALAIHWPAVTISVAAGGDGWNAEALNSRDDASSTISCIADRPTDR